MNEYKRMLRKKIKEEIKGLDLSYCMEADSKIYETILALPEYQEATTIFCFVGTVDEINTKPIIQNALDNGKRIVVPVCISKGIMESYEIKSLDELKIGSYGIQEPDVNCATKIEPEEIDLAIIPCLSANEKGQRIGYGGGFYDRYLKRTKAYRAVLCRRLTMRDDIPVEEHDLKMEMVVSEESAVRIV